MAQLGAGDGWDPPSVVQVTVVPGPRRPAAGARVRAAGISSLVALGAAACALLIGGAIAMFHGGAARPAVALPVAATVNGVPASAPTQSYRFPIGCLRITRTHQALAGAGRRGAGSCWRYGVSVTAILWHVGGIWRLALEATSRSCPRVALPAPVRAQLTACRH